MRKLFILIALLFSLNGWCAEINVYIDTDNGSNENGGTSWEDAYANLNNAVQASEQDLTDGDGDTIIFNHRGTAADTTEVRIDSADWTVSSDCYITIQGNNTTGKASANHSRIVTTGNNEYGIYNQVPYTHIHNMEITGSNTYTKDGIYLTPNATNCVITRNIIHDRKIDYVGVYQGDQHHDQRVPLCRGRGDH